VFPSDTVGTSVREADGTVLGYLGIIRDTTDRVAAERAMKEQAIELERSNAELEQFAYVASHDLKAPLRAIDNLSQWIEEDLGGALGDSAENMVLLRKRIKRMERLLTGLLQYSRVGRQELPAEDVDTNSLVADVITMLQIQSPFQIEVTSTLPVLRTQRLLFDQVFTNLVSNAVKHHDRTDGRVEISAVKEGQRWIFRVSDDGPGIAPEMRERVFQIFQTLKRRDEMESSGVGLSIVKKIIERNGGEIRVGEGIDGQGCCFEFSWRERE